MQCERERSREQPSIFLYRIWYYEYLSTTTTDYDPSNYPHADLCRHSVSRGFLLSEWETEC